MFSPFGNVSREAQPDKQKKGEGRDINELKDQLRALQEKIDRLGD